MFRRSVRPAAPEATTPRRPTGAARYAAPGGLAARLSNEGWVLPRGVISGGTPAWTLVGTVASPTVTPVDRAGLVVGEGWSLDWWVGADDPDYVEDAGAFGAVPWLDLGRGYGAYLVIESTSQQGRALANKIRPAIEEQIDAELPS